MCFEGGIRKMFLYNLARKVNAKIKKYKKNKAGRHLSPCRRIEFVNPPKEGRFVAMTFDDGPTTFPTTSNPNKGLTESICETLKKYDAKGTFDIIGTTNENYPDEEGNIGDFTWSGVHFDHYPKFKDDLSAGAINKPELIEKILSEGHEITSHTYSHRLFGPMRAIYGKRTHFQKLSEVVEDLEKLHKYMKERFNYEMKLSRPPHYIDNIPDGSSSYDAYRIMGYNYMAASFDGAGWQPLESYEKEILAMIMPLKEALSKDPDSLNGKIIFQKDGCNMNLRTPVADALDEQLKILSEYGYKVITVSELLELSPFEDVSNNTSEMKYIKELLKLGHVIGYKNNTFAPDKFITEDEFYIMCANPDIFRQKKALTYKEMALIAKDFAIKNNIILNNSSGNALLEVAKKHGIKVNEELFNGKKNIKRIDTVELIYELSKKVG